MNVSAASVRRLRRQVYYCRWQISATQRRHDHLYCFAAFAVECPEHLLQSREAVACQNEVSNLGPVQFSFCAQTNPPSLRRVRSREKSLIATKLLLFCHRCPKCDAGPAMIVVEHRKNLLACFKSWMSPFDCFHHFGQSEANLAQLHQKRRFQNLVRRGRIIDRGANALAPAVREHSRKSRFLRRTHGHGFRDLSAIDLQLNGRRVDVNDAGHLMPAPIPSDSSPHHGES